MAFREKLRRVHVTIKDLSVVAGSGSAASSDDGGAGFLDRSYASTLEKTGDPILASKVQAEALGTLSTAAPSGAPETVVLDSDYELKFPGFLDSAASGQKASDVFCPLGVDALPRRYEITVTDALRDPAADADAAPGERADFVGRVILRAYPRDGAALAAPGDELLDTPRGRGGCQVL